MTPENSTADLLAHLRSIHLAFILAAAGIFMAVSSSDTVFETATQQLRDVVQIADVISADKVSASILLSVDPQAGGDSSADPDKLRSFVENALLEYFEAMEVHPEGFELRSFRVESMNDQFGYVGGIDDFLEFEQERSWFERHLALLREGETIHTSPNYLFDGLPRTLEGYRLRINRLLNADELYLQPGFHGQYLFRSTVVAERYPGLSEQLREQLNAMSDFQVSLSLKKINLTDVRSRMIFAESQGHAEEDPAGYDDYDFKFDELVLDCRVRATVGEAVSFELVLPVMFRTQQPEFVADTLRQPNFDDTYYARYLSGAQTFARLFPELMQVSNHLMSLSPEDLGSFLEDQRQKSGAPISVLGLQVSRDLIEVWGVLLMLTIQLYFCMHYRTLLDRLTPDEDVVFPWIGVYRHRLSALVFQFSLALPSAVTLFAAFKSRPVEGIGWYAVILLVFAIALLIWAETIYIRSRKILG